MTRALIGQEGGVPPILLVCRRGWRFGVYLHARGRRLAFGPVFGWIWERA